MMVRSMNSSVRTAEDSLEALQGLGSHEVISQFPGTVNEGFALPGMWSVGGITVSRGLPPVFDIISRN